MFFKVYARSDSLFAGSFREEYELPKLYMGAQVKILSNDYINMAHVYAYNFYKSNAYPQKYWLWLRL